MDHLVVNSWGYRCTHWVYVVLSRVRTLKSLILNVKLDENRDYSAKQELLRWEKDLKESVESKHLKLEGHQFMKNIKKRRHNINMINYFI